MAQTNETVVLDSSNELLMSARNLLNQGKELLFSNPLSAAGIFADSTEAFLSLYQTKISNATFQAALGQTGILNLSASLGSLGSALADYRNGKEGGLFNIFTSLSPRRAYPPAVRRM